MFALPARLWRLSLDYPRAVGTAAALAAFIYVKLSAGGDLLDLTAVVLPAVEFAMFALIFALYRDSFAPRMAGSQIFGTMMLWFVADFMATWLWVAAARAGMEAYVKLGAPPAFDLSI